MNYGMLDEVYGPGGFSQDEISKTNVVINSKKKENFNVKGFNDYSDDENDEIDEYYENFVGFPSGHSIKSNVQSILKKIEPYLNNPDLKNILKKKLGLIEDDKKKNTIEHFYMPQSDYSDIILLVILGIFVIFILDSCVRIGMHLKK